MFKDYELDFFVLVSSVFEWVVVGGFLDFIELIKEWGSDNEVLFRYFIKYMKWI